MTLNKLQSFCLCIPLAFFILMFCFSLISFWEIIQCLDLKLGISEKSIFQEFHPDAEDLFNVTCDLKLVCEKLRDRSQRHKRQVCFMSWVQILFFNNLIIFVDVPNLAHNDGDIRPYLTLKLSNHAFVVSPDSKFPYWDKLDGFCSCFSNLLSYLEVLWCFQTPHSSVETLDLKI